MGENVNIVWLCVVSFRFQFAFISLFLQWNYFFGFFLSVSLFRVWCSVFVHPFIFVIFSTRAHNNNNNKLELTHVGRVDWLWKTYNNYAPNVSLDSNAKLTNQLLWSSVVRLTLLDSTPQIIHMLAAVNRHSAPVQYHHHFTSLDTTVGVLFITLCICAQQYHNLT